MQVEHDSIISPDARAIVDAIAGLTDRFDAFLAGGVPAAGDGDFDVDEQTALDAATRVDSALAGIEGLPDGLDARVAADRRYSVDFPDGLRMIVQQDHRQVVLVTPRGAIIVIGSNGDSIGIGDTVTSQAAFGGGTAIRARDSGYAAFAESSGILHITLCNAVEVVVRFE